MSWSNCPKIFLGVTKNKEIWWDLSIYPNLFSLWLFYPKSNLLIEGEIFLYARTTLVQKRLLSLSMNEIVYIIIWSFHFLNSNWTSSCIRTWSIEIAIILTFWCDHSFWVLVGYSFFSNEVSSDLKKLFVHFLVHFSDGHAALLRPTGSYCINSDRIIWFFARIQTFHRGMRTGKGLLSGRLSWLNEFLAVC